jgi:phage terminase large subunit-like protein
MSERAAIVNDTFHGKDVQLDGYSGVLTITNLKKSDLNVSYRLQLSHGASQTALFSSVAWYLRKRISLFHLRVPQTAKFIRNISSLPLYVR